VKLTLAGEPFARREWPQSAPGTSPLKDVQICRDRATKNEMLVSLQDQGTRAALDKARPHESFDGNWETGH
jgi:hypothetical protein